VAKIKDIVLSNCRITLRKVADEVNISYGSCEAIFTDILGLKRVAAKFILKLLNFEQKQNRKNIAEQMLAEVTNDPEMLKRIKTKVQSSQWAFPGESRTKKACQV